ncbi:E3 ubiquitin-protein ligase MIB2-like isoform X2 [Littorina saxatilis]|uniref:E3 ubiquitin-protein ligase MIB2-like isoform X2 n=1 Tax=Littorina saxatilis TaxID=31220 RepID=UPI0038B4A67D
MEVGLRVVRGPDWKWGNQDGGEGFVGTVVEVGKPGSTTSPDKTVVVHWDSGARTNYRVGYQGAYDLRIYDNAPIGLRHTNIICDSCQKQGVQGMRWKCTRCHDFDLCSLCFMGDKHDINHAFYRFDSPSSKGVKLPKRSTSSKVQAFGIFGGARVIRGPDWDWANQDGGEGKIGKVSDIRGWDSESGRSVAHVTWCSGSTNVYRVGHKGKVDLKYITASSGGFYYRDHLPVLGEAVEPANPVTPCLFKVGDKVRCDLENEVLKQMQEGHGGWNQRMSEYVGKVGTVHRITDRGDVRVQYDGCANRWTFHPDALRKVQMFGELDKVKIVEDEQQVKELQKNHGEWTDVMRQTLGKTGQVLKVYSDGDLRVQVEGQVWTFNPACCLPVAAHGGGHHPDNTLNGHHPRDRLPELTSLIAQLNELRTSQGAETGPDRLVREAAQGHLETVRDILAKYPEKVDQKSSGKTALQVACHQGHRDIVSLLLSADASLETQDEDGDTALHYSAFGNQPDVLQLLLAKGAKINALNNGGCSTLHVAVNKQHVACVRALLNHGCDVNIQDAYGDTALHDAIGKESREIIDKLVNYPNIDFTIRNKRGFNVLHHAALKGNVFATERILHKCRQIVDLKKDDGFSALHLASLNGHKDVAAALLRNRAEVDIRNNRQQTPLLLSVSQGHSALIELLVKASANINVHDEDGDTCLHLALMRQTVATEKDTSPMLEEIRTQLGMGEDEAQTGAAIACYLAQQGASLTAVNQQGKTPLEVITDPRTVEILQQFAAAYASGNKPKMTPAFEEEEAAECEVCCTQPPSVVFDPCGHCFVCEDCCIKMKKCLKCKVTITAKKKLDGSVVAGTGNTLDLKRRLQEMEDSLQCAVCMERKKDTVFMCGHAVCGKCSEALSICPMCRKAITKRIPLYT